LAEVQFSGGNLSVVVIVFMEKCYAVWVVAVRFVKLECVGSGFLAAGNSPVFLPSSISPQACDPIPRLSRVVPDIQITLSDKYCHINNLVSRFV
jgi:hypothetical protein